MGFSLNYKRRKLTGILIVRRLSVLFFAQLRACRTPALGLGGRAVTGFFLRRTPPRRTHLFALHLFALWGWTHIEKCRLLVSKLSVWNGMICSLCYRFSLTAHIRIRSIVRRHNFKSTYWLWPATHYQLYLHGPSWKMPVKSEIPRSFRNKYNGKDVRRQEMLRGYIFHLLLKEQIGAIQLHDFRIDDGCFGYPVLILDTT
jgi:hypothetical protein